MLSWVKKYWPALILIALLIAILDGTFSSLMTCHPVSDNSSHTADAKQAKENCTALNGPLLNILFLIADLAHKYEGAITAAFTIVLAIFTGRLWFSTEKLWQATNTLASDAKVTASAQAADTRILQRAYIAVDGGGISPLAQTSVAHINIRNVGNLPAKEVKWFICAEISDDGRRSDFPIDETKFYGSNVVPPGTNMLRSQNFLFLPSIKFDSIRTGEKLVYVWGEIRYLDGFNEKRFTRFCHRYGRRGYRTTVNPDGHLGMFIELTAESMRYHQYGNDAD